MDLSFDRMKLNPGALLLFHHDNKKPRRLSPSGPFIGLRYFSIAFRHSYNTR
jgi:hypothetical protein